MLENEDLLVRLSQEQNLSYVIDIDGRFYNIQSITILKSQIPVRKPTTRGGVYFTDTTAYKIKAVTNLSIKDEIPKLMLGPNTDFKPVLVKTSLEIENAKHFVTLVSHLTNAVNTNDKVELNLIVDRVELK